MSFEGFQLRDERSLAKVQAAGTCFALSTPGC